ncbi:MAG: hypothetical protein RML40_08735, partial [Bacteroidota bacterium]|nr:hypothetical protein [Candidatus Kapabacteria bacterium]MDW8220602.1 hypothetical protein [Bacteroidota bacterium]
QMLCLVHSSLLSYREFSSDAVQARVGIGGRIYVLTQEPIVLLSNRPPSSTEFVNRAYAPEALMEFSFPTGTVVRVHGWYEFQFDKISLLRGVPNILLSAMLSL